MSGRKAGRWRYLRRGEVLRAGDQCWHGAGEWLPTLLYGCRVGPNDARMKCYRRRVAGKGAK